MEEDEAGEESRSQITENSLSFDDYLGDVNLVVFTTLYSVTPAGLSKDFFFFLRFFLRWAYNDLRPAHK